MCLSHYIQWRTILQHFLCKHTFIMLTQLKIIFVSFSKRIGCRIWGIHYITPEELYVCIYIHIVLPYGNNPSGPRPSHYRGFMITLRRTTLGRTPLDEWSFRRRDLYLATNNTHKRQTSMPPAGSVPTVPESERPQTHVLYRAATGDRQICIE